MARTSSRTTIKRGSRTRSTAHVSVRIVEALTSAYQDIQRHYKSEHIPDCVILIGSVARHGVVDRWGHYHHAIWHEGKLPGHIEFSKPTSLRAGTSIYKRNPSFHNELLISAEGLGRQAKDVFETLLHEAAHAANAQGGIEDTSRYGRYHNRRFLERAVRMGLDAKQTQYGYCATILLPDTQRIFEPTIKRLMKALGVWRMVEPWAPQKNNRQVRATCKCDNVIRASRKLLTNEAPYCHACNSRYITDDADSEGAENAQRDGYVHKNPDPLADGDDAWIEGPRPVAPPQ